MTHLEKVVAASVAIRERDKDESWFTRSTIDGYLNYRFNVLRDQFDPAREIDDLIAMLADYKKIIEAQP